MSRSSQNLADWLGERGLGQYAQTFADNHIEYSVLPYLTDDDLKNLGLSLGHRKRLLKAIEAIDAIDAKPLPSEPVRAVAHVTTEAVAVAEKQEPRHEPEVRQI